MEQPVNPKWNVMLSDYGWQNTMAGGEYKNKNVFFCSSKFDTENTSLWRVQNVWSIFGIAISEWISLCAVFCNEINTCQFRTFIVAIVIAATCFGYVKYPSSGCIYQKCKNKENYRPAALHTVTISGLDVGLPWTCLCWTGILMVCCNSGLFCTY